MPTPEERLAKLELKKKEIEASMQKIRKDKSRSRREFESQKKYVIGGAILKAVREGQWPPREPFLQWLDRVVTRTSDRRYFEELKTTDVAQL